MKTMRVEQIEVFINNGGSISIAQENNYDEPSVVGVHPSQVELLCQWLRDAAKELEQIESKKIAE